MSYFTDRNTASSRTSVLKCLDLSLSEYSRIQTMLDDLGKPETNSPNMLNMFYQRCILILEEFSGDLDKIASTEFKVK